MLAHTNNPVCGSIVMLMVMVVSTLVRFSDASPRRSSALQSEESSGLSPFPLMGGIRDSMLNPVHSLASAKVLVSCGQNCPCARSPLLSMLRLVGHVTCCEMK